MAAMQASELDRPLVSYEEYLAWPERSLPCEFVDGHAVMSPAPELRHQLGVARLHHILQAALPQPWQVIESPVDWVLRRSPLLVRQPDLAIIDPTQVTGPRLTEPPLLVAEVLSPTSHERDLVTKRREYAEAGLDWFWLVDIERPQILVLRRRGEAFVPTATAQGPAALTVEEPFRVHLRPMDLV